MTMMLRKMALLSLLISILGCISFTVNAATSSETSIAEQTCANGVNNETKTCNSTPSQTSECGVWVGLSTLPGTGIGMFAGKDFRKGDPLLSLGDHIIPIVDLGLNHAEDTSFFLWNEYTWNSGYFGMTRMGIEEVDVASPGFGATANSFMDFVNVQEEDTARYSVPDDVHRSKDPEAGAFTYYHSRNSFAEHHIWAGEELFVSYGDKWFQGRKESIGPIPLYKDHIKAENLHIIFQQKMIARFPNKLSVMQDLWDIFVADPNNLWESSIFAALPAQEDYEEMNAIGLVELKRQKMVRSQEWLEKNAVCADNFYFGNSTIPKAGHGVFALRFLAKGTAVLPVPLIHIPDRSILDMYEPTRQRTNESIQNPGKQLLLNYCLGHANSTMLLSPYGPVFNVINHNQTQANVRLQWALPERSNHFPEMLEKDPSHFSDVKSAKLAMEVIALKDIQPGEEISLDYGDEWEEAWQKHLSNWKPEKDSEGYISAHEMNKRRDRLKTEFEQAYDPYPSNLALVFKEGFQQKSPYKNSEEKGQKDFRIKTRESDDATCEILRFEKKYGRTVYAAVLANKDSNDGSTVLVEDLPREAFEFQDRPHTTDMFLRNAFRHDIRIPDDIFPEVWKNIR